MNEEELRLETEAAYTDWHRPQRAAGVSVSYEAMKAFHAGYRAARLASAAKRVPPIEVVRAGAEAFI